jgi:hydroxymethylbilane synthase
MSNPVIRIGTRDSELALWQAKHVAQKIQDLGFETLLVPVKSTGDIILDKPLYELGITGIFTKTLDVAMIQGQIDIAVHSLKDVPTVLPKGMVQGAVLERANPLDILVHKNQLDFLNQPNLQATIATGSLRRKAQWLNRFPNHEIVDLRGNVNSRLQKLANHNWHGAIFAAAGLERINLTPKSVMNLDWMIPAPAQGIVMCAVMESNDFCKEILAQINHKDSEICAHIERQFLRTLEGGCTAPIGAYAQIQHQKINFKGGLFSLNGTQKIIVEKESSLTDFSEIGKLFATDVLQNGGRFLMQEIKAIMQHKPISE